MDDQDKPFDVPDIEPYGADSRDVMHLLQSKAYNDFFVPFIIGCIRSYHKQLADPSIQRRWKKPDNYLRGAIAFAEALIALPENVLQAKVRKDKEDAEVLEETARYEDLAAGGHGPFGEDQMGLSPTDPI